MEKLHVIRNLKEDLQIVKPTFLASAPRLWESIYQGIMANLEKAPAARRSLFYLAYSVSKNFHSASRFLRFLELDLEGRSIVTSFFVGLYQFAVLVTLFLPNLYFLTSHNLKIMLSFLYSFFSKSLLLFSSAYTCFIDLQKIF